MEYDFESRPDRRNSGSYKWDLSGKQELDNGAFPFSVADMEWRTPPEIRKACADFAENGFYCYTGADSAYRQAVVNFMLRRHNWKIEEEDIVCTPGVVSAINTAIRCYTEKGDGVIIQQPVYYPFANSINNNSRRLVNNQLVIRDGRYEINFEELERLASEEKNKLMLFCSPHNPVGRVWTREEAARVGEICLKNGVVLISDEIHFDITRVPHTVMPLAKEGLSCNTVVCTAISKSFNAAGLGTSNIIIQNRVLREKFCKQLETDGYSCINAFSRPATVAAYTQCDEWLNEANRRIDKNFEILAHFIRTELPEAVLYEREGTYLAWLDMAFLGLDDEKLNDFLIHDCGIIPDPGYWFGEGGSGFTRLNLAVPADVLTCALDRLKTACSRR